MRRNSVFRMTDRLPEREPSAGTSAAVEDEWPAIARDLGSLDAQIRRLTTSGRVDELAVRRARRAGRRVLRPARTGAQVARFGGDAA